MEYGNVIPAGGGVVVCLLLGLLVFWLARRNDPTRRDD
jgi:hypothetical protein